MKKGFKRIAAWTLAAVMAIQSAGTAMAWSWGTPSIKTEGQTVTVTFDAGEGHFEKWVWLRPSGSNAAIQTKSNANESKISVKVNCEEVLPGPYYGADLYGAQYELYDVLHPSYLRQSLSPKEIAETEPVRDGYEFGGWFADKYDPNSKVPVDGEKDFGVNCYLDGTVYANCTLYAHWLKDAENESSQVEDVIAYGLKDGETLKVRDLEDEKAKTDEQLAAAVKNNQMGFGKLMDNAVQLDIFVEGKTDKEPVGVTMRIPDDIDEEQPIAVIHFGKDKTELISPAVENGTLSFALTTFSPVIIVNAERSCQVEVKNVTGGLVYCYHELQTEDGEEKPGIKFLPIGEVSEVPYGTELMLETEEFGEGDNWTSELKYIKITREGQIDYLEASDSLTVKGAAVIEGIFVKNESPEVEGEGGNSKSLLLKSPKAIYSTPTKVDLPITAIFQDGKAQTDVSSDVKFDFDESYSGRHDNDKFGFDGSHLVSVETLEAGRYTVRAIATYTKDGIGYRKPLRKTITIGYGLELSVSHGAYYDSYYEDYFHLYSSLAGSMTASNRFKDAKAACDEDSYYDLTNIQMYNYDFDGWYMMKSNGAFGVKAVDNTLLNVGQNEASAKFVKDGRTYRVELKHFDNNGGTKPTPDGDHDSDGSDSDSGSNSGSSSGSGNSSESGQSNMYGCWKQDANGWWFQKTDGSYAKSEWGQLNGKWYWFNDQGYMATGWIPLNGVWYFLNTDGTMESSNWILLNGTWYYLNANGSMAANQWIPSNEKWYYVNQDGAMAVDTVTPDGYRVDASGAWVP